MNALQRLRFLAIPALLLLIHLPHQAGHARDRGGEYVEKAEPSSMGAIFMGKTSLPRWYIQRSPGDFVPPIGFAPFGIGSGDINVTPGVPRFQSETSIAAYNDSIVVGFNDADGFSTPLGTSVSGFSYSHDGGNTFTYGGQLPLFGFGEAVRGDPDVKVWVNPVNGKATFVYSSLYLTPGGLFSLCVHVSTDGGMTWSLPREATTVSSAIDFADKEFLDIDPETGRILLSWTSFGATLQMRTTYSDDFGLTWAPVTAFSARPTDGQGSCPRFDPNSNRAYIVWWNYTSPASISFVRSSDNGVTWSAPADVITGLFTPARPYGSDRVNGFPSLAVGPVTGNLHLMYGSSHLGDFGDVFYATSSDSGNSWSFPAALNSNPGSDRAQFFAWISAQDVGGSEWLDAIWYDQRAGMNGSDLTEVVHAHSLNGGASWSAPVPLLSKPFHAEYGNDTGQPNIGDYNQVFSQNGGLYASYARTGVPDYQTNSPDTYFSQSSTNSAAAPLYIKEVRVVDDVGCQTDGYIEPDEVATIEIELANGDPAMSVTGISGVPISPTGELIVLHPDISWPDLAAGASAVNSNPIRVVYKPANGCDIDPLFDGLELVLTTDQGPAELDADLPIPLGAPVTVDVLLDEDFDGVGSGLPVGWSHIQRLGVNNPWAVSNVLSNSSPNSMFCVDRPDTNWSRVETPVMAIPDTADIVQVSFAVTYHNEEVGDGRRGWDGSLLKLEIDGSDVLAGAFSTLFEGQYLMCLIRQSGALENPLEDLSAWTGNTLPNFENIKIQYPGLAGRNVALAWEMGSDGFVGATGTYVDDVRVEAIDFGCQSCTQSPTLAYTPAMISFPATDAFTTACSTVTLYNTGDGVLEIASVTGCDSGDFNLDLTNLDTYVLPGDSSTFEICVTPTSLGPDSCTAVVVTNDGTANILATIQIVTAAGDDSKVPTVLTLEPVKPNPFNPHAQIRFSLPRTEPVWVTVYDLAGRRVRSILNGHNRDAGPNTIVWNGTDEGGREVASGVYWIQVRTAEESKVTKAVLLR